MSTWIQRHPDVVSNTQHAGDFDLRNRFYQNRSSGYGVSASGRPHEIQDAIEETSFVEDTVIDIGEATPLLAGEVAVAESASVVPGVVGGVAAGAVAGGAAYGVYKLATGGRNSENETNVLKGHHFIGPGNKVGFQPPVNEADAIAKEHDIDYSRAQTQEDVRRADTVAIDKFAKDGSVPSRIGQFGLTIKHGIETHTGVLYPPSLPTGKQWFDLSVLTLVIDLIGLF